MAGQGEAEKPKPEEEEEGFGRVRLAAIALGCAFALVLGWRWCGGGAPPAAAPAAPSGAASADSPPSAAGDAAAPAGPRCAPATAGASFVVGEAPPPRRAIPTDDAAPPDPEPEEEDLAPFAVQIGRGTTYDGGFAVGALRDGEGGTIAAVVTLGKDGGGGKVVRLARSRGDIDPPVVAGSGASVLIGMLEPNAGGRALKLAKVTGDEVTWGAELAQGRDESLAIDLAVVAGGARGVVVWDDLDDEKERSIVQLATFDAATMRSITSARPVTPPKTDAESPRVIARPGGFWLAYRVTGAAKAASPPSGKEAEADEARGGEAIAASWIEAMPLDENGAPAGTPRRATPKDGHVLAFDLEPGDDGSAILAWRDDDTPSGSSGGSVSTALLRLGGIGEPRVIAEEGVGAGTPDLLPGWIGISGASGPKRLAPLTGAGELGGELAVEPSFGAGEPVAGAGDAILLATPAGRAMRLAVVRCGAPAPR